jgi:hypothetical protein
MSYASSSASATSCVLQGRVVTVEEALDQVTRDAQGRLTELQIALRNLCAVEDQSIDEEDDFKNAVSLGDQVEDFVTGLADLLSELPQIAADIVGPAPKALKDWYKTHTASRKEKAKARQSERKESDRERKEAVKKMKAATLTNIAE